MVFDGECGFCRLWIRRWRQTTGDRVEYLPYQDEGLAGRFPEIPRERFTQAVHLIETDGTVRVGAEASVSCLRHGGTRWALWGYRNVPWVAPLSEAAYRWVAGHRTWASRLTRWGWGDSVERPDTRLTRWLFLRWLGVVYLLAFVSLWTQVEGLIGSQGILPVGEYLENVSEMGQEQGWGTGIYWMFPTLSWINTSDAFLHFICAAGAGLSVLLVAGISPVLCLLFLWVLYLSLVTSGQVFLGFQWDNLLLETGLLAMFLAPGGWQPRWRRDKPPSRAALWLLRWLLFRLMFASGCLKWLSGDPTWRDGTALSFHYETQPLPTVLGWYAHHLPGGFQALSVWIMFFIEMILPFLIFAPRRIRSLAAWPLLGLQGLIALTGNYGFFNLLTVALTLLLFDDRSLIHLIPKRWRGRVVGESSVHSEVHSDPTCVMGRLGASVNGWERLRRCVLATVAGVVLILTAKQMADMFLPRIAWPGAIRTLESRAYPWRSINRYGLFRVMTTSRPEILIEGSRDGETWEPYVFRYKPGPLQSPPGWVAPHMPRLDWQMWFAALGSYRQNPWFVRFCVRLLEGSPTVLDLLESHPFPDEPPTFLRATVYDYRFTDGAERSELGHWWKREELGPYVPVLRKRMVEDSKP